MRGRRLQPGLPPPIQRCRHRRLPDLRRRRPSDRPGGASAPWERLLGRGGSPGSRMRLFPAEFRELARVRDCCVADPLCMILYTCCNSRGRLVELCGDLGLPIVFDIIKTALEEGFREDWLPLLLSKICLEESCFPLLFDKLSFVDKFTSEQTFLVRLLAEKLDQRFNEVTVSDAFASAVLSILCRASTDVNFASRGTSALPTGDPAIDVLGYSLITLRNICAREDPPRPSIDSLIS